MEGPYHDSIGEMYTLYVLPLTQFPWVSLSSAIMSVTSGCIDGSNWKTGLKRINLAKVR